MKIAADEKFGMETPGGVDPWPTIPNSFQVIEG